MRVFGTFLNGTPIFKITPESLSPEPWCRAYGATASGRDWLFPAYYPAGMNVFKDLRILSPSLVWDASTIPHLRALHTKDALWKKTLKDYEEKRHIELPEGIEFPKGFEPYQHQRMGITMVATWHRGWFLWEMGTGKTRTLVDGYRLSRREDPGLQRMLVIAPPVVLPTWLAEVDRCSQGELVATLWDGKDASYERALKSDVVVLSYARARLEFDKKYKGPKRLLGLDYQCITADESHSIGNHDSAQTQAVLMLSSKASRRYLLSGTAADHPGKLYPQFRFLSPGMMPMDWRKYKDTYYVYSQFVRGQVFGYKHLDDLNARVNDVASRMKKSDCLDLPPVTFIDVPFDLAPDQVDVYDACIARLKDFDAFKASLEKEGLNVAVSHGGALVNKLLQIVSGFVIVGADPQICDGCSNLLDCVQGQIKPYTPACKVIQSPPPTEIRELSNPKLDAFTELVDNILQDNPDNKVIVWGSYLRELDDMELAVMDLGYGYVRVDGSSTSRIGELAKTFQTDPECRVYIGQVSSGVGVTLTAASYMIYYSLTWNLVAYKQSLERNNRPGQTRSMFVYRMLSSHPGALDHFLARALMFKNAVAYTMLERVACSGCENSPTCAKEEIKPFQKGCKYSSEVAKSTATAEYLRGKP